MTGLRACGSSASADSPLRSAEHCTQDGGPGPLLHWVSSTAPASPPRSAPLRSERRHRPHRGPRAARPDVSAAPLPAPAVRPLPPRLGWCRCLVPAPGSGRRRPPLPAPLSSSPDAGHQVCGGGRRVSPRGAGPGPALRRSAGAGGCRAAGRERPRAPPRAVGDPGAGAARPGRAEGAGLAGPGRAGRTGPGGSGRGFLRGRDAGTAGPGVQGSAPSPAKPWGCCCCCGGGRGFRLGPGRSGRRQWTGCAGLAGRAGPRPSLPPLAAGLSSPE